jgi:hypothetical protein
MVLLNNKNADFKAVVKLIIWCNKMNSGSAALNGQKIKMAALLTLDLFQEKLLRRL